MLQLNYIKIFILCSVLGRLQRESRNTRWPEQDEAELRGATSRLLSVMMGQLSLFLDTPVYKWQLKWAPSYSVVTIAFTGWCMLLNGRGHTNVLQLFLPSRSHVSIRTWPT